MMMTITGMAGATGAMDPMAAMEDPMVAMVDPMAAMEDPMAVVGEDPMVVVVMVVMANQAPSS